MRKLSSSRKRKSGTLFLILLFLLAGSAGGTFLLFFEGEAPVLEIETPKAYVGADTTIDFFARDQKSGLRYLSLTLTQGEQTRELYAESFARNGSVGTVGQPEKKVKVSFEPAKEGFKDGPAVLTVSAADYSFRRFLKGNLSTLSQDVVIDTTPPKIGILHSERYINPGGSGIVIYTIDDPEAVAGVQINGGFNPGYPVGDGRDDTYIAFFGLRYDAPDINESFVVGSDPAGNTGKLPFSVIYKKSDFRHDRIDVSNGFLEKKIPEFEQHYPEMQGPLVQKYLYTNNELRKINNQQISEICRTSRPERLWQGRFLRMSGSTRAGYADHRTYYHENTSIDKQVHLGIDIASTRHAEVKAAADGVVVFADYLGIYGNMIILDHGQGVFSLYSHLSQISVSVEDAVKQGSGIGLTGTSGMAGGDHLHFSVLVNGIFVTPKEWWDQHWIDVTIDEPLTESRFH